MQPSTEIGNELKQISPFLAEMEKKNVFSVPEGYFEDFNQKILTSIFLSQEDKSPMLQVPNGYFEGLSDRILSEIKKSGTFSADEEIKALSPALHYLKQENVFSVPATYFNDLNKTILTKVKKEETKEIPLDQQKKWWKYAAAAVVATAITIGSLQFFGTNTVSQDPTHTVATLSSFPAYEQLASQYQTQEQLSKGIASLSDDEIVYYLESHGNILDNDTIINDLDTKGLPDEDDYLTDENTLNNFLTSLNAGTVGKNMQ